MLSVSVVSDKRAKTRTNTSAETKERGYTAGHAGRKVSVESGLLSLLLLELCWNSPWNSRMRAERNEVEDSQETTWKEKAIKQRV